MPQLAALLRDAWWIMILILVASVVSAIYVAWLVGIAFFVIGAATLGYFALVRYDEHGRPRG